MTPIAIDSGTVVPTATTVPTPRFSEWLAAMLLRVKQARHARRHSKALEGLSDRQLEDIGLVPPERTRRRRCDLLIVPFAGG